MLSNELVFLMNLTGDLYRKPHVGHMDFSRIDCNKFIKIALKNNILYYSAKKLLNNDLIPISYRDRFRKIAQEGDYELAQIQKSIQEIHVNIEGALIFKTYRGKKFFRIGNDVDVLISASRMEGIKKKFIDLGYCTEFDDPREKSVGLLKEGQKKIHLQGDITWCWNHFLDEDLIYREPRSVNYNGQEIVVPNVNADLLIHLAHMNFEPLLMIYSELLYIFQLFQDVDFDLLLNQVGKYCWQRTFLRTVNLINNFHKQFYGEVCTKAVKFKHLRLQEIKFPYFFSKQHLCLMCIEKRLFVYPLTKSMKIIDLFINRDAYRYIDAPERKTVEIGAKIK